MSNSSIAAQLGASLYKTKADLSRIKQKQVTLCDEREVRRFIDRVKRGAVKPIEVQVFLMDTALLKYMTALISLGLTVFIYANSAVYN